MLTKWGNALGLASAGRIVSLSGGGPLGDATIWPAVGNWADLSTIPAGDIRDNDEVPVNTLGTPHSSGIAQRHGSEWRLMEGKWETVADMVAWNTTPGQVVHSGAFAQVKDNGGHDDDSVTYIYQGGNWVRFAGLTAGYAWALSSLQDFSAIGLQTGDFGILNNQVYRLTSALSLPGGGSARYWVRPNVYAGSISVAAYLIGNESVTLDTTLNARGWASVTRTNGAITSQTTRVRLATTAASGDVGISALNSGVTTTTKVYAQMLWRSAIGTGSGSSATGNYFGQFADGANYLSPSYHSTGLSKGTYFWTGSGTSNSGINQTTQAAIPNLSGTDDLIELIYDEATNISQLWRNGVLVSASLRFAGVLSDRFRIVSWSGSTAVDLSSQDVSNVMVATW